jgi:hypothetical protein
VLMVRSAPGLPPGAEFGGTWADRYGIHKLFPYLPLTNRLRGDGAPWTNYDASTLPGLTRRIPLVQYHAYKVIDPAADATSIDLTLEVPRAAWRSLHFVDPDGNPISSVTVRGLVPRPWGVPWTVILDGSQAEVLALEPEKAREVTVHSPDGKYATRVFIAVDDPQPRIVRLEPAGTFTGRLLDAATDRPIAGYDVVHPHAYYQLTEKDTNWSRAVKTDGEGRFVLTGVIPNVTGTIQLREPPTKTPWIRQAETFSPEALKDLVLKPGEVRDLGDIRITPPVDPPPAKPQE